MASINLCRGNGWCSLLHGLTCMYVTSIKIYLSQNVNTTLMEKKLLEFLLIQVNERFDQDFCTYSAEAFAIVFRHRYFVLEIRNFLSV